MQEISYPIDEGDAETEIPRIREYTTSNYSIQIMDDHQQEPDLKTMKRQNSGVSVVEMPDLIASQSGVGPAMYEQRFR